MKAMSLSPHRDLLTRWGRWRPLPDADARGATREWAAALGVRQDVRLERVHHSQVTDHTGRRGCSLVGVVWNEARACIYHTRRLMGEDIIHEMLHVAHPEWSEPQVVAETERMVRASARRRRRRRTETWSGRGHPPAEYPC